MSSVNVLPKRHAENLIPSTTSLISFGGSSLSCVGKTREILKNVTDGEKNYAQIEKELLAVIFGMKKFYHYTFARPVTVITDHKPLVFMANKPLSKAPKRLQSIFLNLQAFDYHLIYKPGAQLHISVSLSRAPVTTSDDIYTCNISDTPFNDSRLSEIKVSTLLNPAPSQLKLTILQGWPDLKSDLPSSVLPYFNH
ncbi:retrovirus-related pol polyprotein from [Plakobranchus ocellatus]|uniref:Retrovirus-related pol polyprotein from n=1 Tax=Plakobranchus ocellatus TaxID=259542 RepID=A0AAV4D4G2_9GAST|nr:retrovirus-related pol polyprotein from [Plakobranchus ocellatus]